MGSNGPAQTTRDGLAPRCGRSGRRPCGRSGRRSWKTRLSWVTTTTARSGRTAAFAEQFHDGQAGLVVERGRRLVADQQPRLVHQGPGDRHPLHLPAGELAGQAVQLLAHPERCQDLAGAADGPLVATSRRSPAGSPRSRRPSRPAGGCIAGRRSRYSARGTGSAARSLIAVSSLAEHR